MFLPLLFQYTVSEIQFLPVNYTLIAWICKRFYQNKPCWWRFSKRKQYVTGFIVNKMFLITFHTAKHYFPTLLPVILRLFIKNELHG